MDWLLILIVIPIIAVPVILTASQGGRCNYYKRLDKWRKKK